MSLRNTSLWTNELAIKWPWINSNEGWTANDPQLKYKFVRRRSSRSESEDMWSPDSSPQSKKGHDCDAFSGKLVPISRLLSECHHDNSDTNTSPFPPASAHISFHASHGREPAFCLPCVFPVRVMQDSATQPGWKSEWGTTILTSCLDPELHVLTLRLFVTADGRVFKSLSISKHSNLGSILNTWNCYIWEVTARTLVVEVKRHYVSTFVVDYSFCEQSISYKWRYFINFLTFLQV